MCVCVWEIEIENVDAWPVAPAHQHRSISFLAHLLPRTYHDARMCVYLIAMCCRSHLNTTTLLNFRRRRNKKKERNETTTTTTTTKMHNFLFTHFLLVVLLILFSYLLFCCFAFSIRLPWTTRPGTSRAHQLPSFRCRRCCWIARDRRQHLIWS